MQRATAFTNMSFSVYNLLKFHSTLLRKRKYEKGMLEKELVVDCSQITFNKSQSVVSSKVSFRSVSFSVILIRLMINDE